MKLSTLLLPTVGLGLGVALMMPAQQAEAWTTIGGSLGQSQRDFRVFNNFSDASDNNNQTPDDQFPGYQGAVMAIWKGVVEWGSLPHGDGSGDSTQAAIGSGEANFDPSFQGLATQVGSTNNNIHSQIGGSNPATLAYCETPISDGWRIRYYEGWSWGDGPGVVANNQFDLQSVACHEYGHALGLGHSDANNATMYPSTPPGSEAGRSITNDDRAGLAAIYGTMSATKPVISDVFVSSGQITINGTGFDSSGNQVWFTQANAGGNGTPVILTNVVSNGTSITVNIPNLAGPGDVLVRRNNTGHAGLSNAWPTDLEPSDGGCGTPTTFCSSTQNSLGVAAKIDSAGSASRAANDLKLMCSGLPSGAAGIFFYGDNEAAIPFGEGVLCVTGNIIRMNVQSADVLGSVEKTLDLNSGSFSSGNGAAITGQSKKFQFWYRDVAGGPSGFNTSDGLSVTFCD